MVVESYGVWKAKPVRYTFQDRHEDSESPHLHLYYTDNEDKEGEAAINIKSGDRKESRLAYWMVPEFSHPITDRLTEPDHGFRLLADTPEQSRGGLALDYIRDNLFQKMDGRILPHDVDGPGNDILDDAIAARSTVYIFGSRFDRGKGVHNVHMNQGSPKPWTGANGIYQGGAFVIQFDDHWEAVFIGFASQAVHTKDGPGREAGQPMPETGYKTWASFLLPETPEANRTEEELEDSPIFIAKALVNPSGPDNQPGGRSETITLANRTDADWDLTGWVIPNKNGDTGQLQSGLRIAAKGFVTVQVPTVALSNNGGTATLLNAEGLKVHGY
ncbi:Uncharacterized protein YukJ [Madurella mycetomatis]|uniref:Uncharacterized protein YukJ n=1 Tax=Madurella mycetomatis TaxID=100816 RepID=A0A175VUF1_9PEZI|nr:Uncharacterized protein YukJ [Madurella mycetomatis]